jgi:gliding motility-associated-like protein
MKKPTFSKFIVFTSLVLMNFVSFAQNDKAFGVRFDKDVQGDMLLIGNNILSKDNNNYTNDAEYNSNIDMKYVDIDNDSNTFSSSSANLVVPNKGCVKILYAGLYWSAILQNGDRSTINTVKFKSPTGGYNNITGEVVWDADSKTVGGNKPYVCYADVTNLMDLSNPNGTYTVANVVSSLGFNGGTGLSAGWSLYIVYEDLTLTSKSITSFDGFSGITQNTGILDINVSGFRTIKTGPVRAKIAFAALEGDKPISGDYLQINGTAMSTTERPSNNFFNSSVTDLNGLYIDRVPASSNTLGYDAGIMKVSNPATILYPGGSVIKNDDTAAKITLGSNQDTYFFYFTAFAVDIIAPKIVLTKVVQDNAGNDIGNTNVTLGDQLNYVIGCQNVGNDNAKSLTIRDVLPINIIFNYPADLMPLPTGVTVKSYNAATREIIFNVDNSVVEVGDAALEIRFKVQVVPECNMLSDACSNSIDNVAYATYKGTLNPDFVLTDDPSANTNTGCLLVKKATNFLVGIDNCKFTKNEVLCTGTVTLKAANGYSSYSWSSSPTGTPVLGTNQTLTVSKIGTYYVHDTAVAPCLSIDEVVTVTSFGGLVDNPVIPFADQFVVCTSDGKKLPNIFLCGANASKLIQTNISDGSIIVWEKLNESAACPAATSATLCANESTSCTWTQVATGPDYSANTAGQFRVTLTYPGGCFNRFYFNVFQNLLNPTATSTDKFCNTPATITVGGIGAGYEYSLDGITYQSSNKFPNPSFPVVTAGAHTVYIRQIGVANGCVFEVKDIQILDKVLKVTPTKVVQPLCFGSKGSIKVGVNDVKGQYTYTLYKDGAFVSTSGLTNALDYEFLNLDGGTKTPLAPIKYRIDVTTDNGCSDSVTVDLIMPDLLTATASLTKPFTCNDGEITVNAVGGTTPYFYFVNSTTVFQTVPQIVVSNPLPAGGVYNIDVVDDNGCKAQTTITVANIPKPVYTVAGTDIKCYGDNTGTIRFDVTNANGYALMYSIDGGATYSDSNVFSNLVANTVYTPQIKYSLGGVDCIDTKPAITLTEPSTKLTASAGVSELAGCGDGVIVPKNNGKIRITNVQGGTPNYEYSFDNQVSWSAIKEAYKAPGTYTVYVRDANKCIFSASVTIDPEPVAPVIDKVDVVYSCDGTAKSTVTVTKPASANYDYTYSIDGTLNTPPSSNVFVGVPAGNHIIKVGYVLTSVTTFSNLLNEDFGRGAPTTTPGIASAYCFNDQHVSPPYFCPNPTRSVEDNQYSVTSFFWRSDDPSSTNVGAWYHFKDHTVFTPAVNDGRYLLVNIGSAAGNYGVLYSKPIVDVIPNQPVKVDLYLGNLLRTTMSAVNPDFIIELVNASGTVVASQATGVIPNNELWNLKSLSLNPGPNTSLTFKIRSGSIAYGGNDAVIDDIRVYQLPKACIDYKDIPLVIASNKKFDATITGTSDISCAGLSDGTITINAVNFDPIAGFEYSIDGNNPWLKSTNPTVIITGLAAGTYTPQVRYNGAGDCKFPLTPTTIIAPAPIVVKTTQTVATCQVGATVDATTTTGGTPAYSFQLINTVAPFTVINFPNTGILNNVPPGTYVVKATDSKGCTANKASNLVIAAPVNPTANIVQNTGLCFDPTSGANITVNVGGGVGPYTYKTIFNGGTASASSPTFSGPTFTYNATVTGTYSFEVYDSYGCKATTADQIINAKLTAAAAVTTALDCDVAPASPDAVITGTISDGTPPFEVTLLSGTGPGTLVQPVGNATTFTYSTAVASTYKFQIKDANNCITTSDVVINPLIPITLTSTDVNPKCNSSSDGSIQLNPGGGSGGFTYSTDGITYTSTSFYSGLSAGTYTYYVKDSNKCTKSITVTLTAPATINGTASVTTPYTCTSPATITVGAVVTGGNGIYSYSLNRDGVAVTSAQNSKIFNNISVVGNYTVTITDSNGCSFTTTPALPIVALNPPLNPTFLERPISCKATELTSDVTVSITAGTGTGILKYETIAPSQIIVPQQGSSTFTGLTPGNYTFKVTDANNCSVTEVYTVDDVLPVIVNGSLVSNVSCKGSSDGKLSFTVSGNSGVFTYVLKNSLNVVVPIAQSTQTGNVIDYTGLSADTYTITITNPTTTCKATKSIPVEESAIALSITAPTITPMTCLVNGKVVINTLGGWGSNRYTLTQPDATVVGPQSSATFTNLTQPGTYSISVTDLNGNGCTVTDTFVIAAKVLPSASIDLVASDLCYDPIGKATIVVTPTVASPTYMYNINNGAYQASGTFGGLVPGSYIVNVKDTSTGCILPLAAQPIATELKFNAVQSKSANCIGQDVEIVGTISGGTVPYTYTVTINGTLDPTVRPVTGTTFTYTDPTATTALGNTTYLFTLSDASVPGCSATSTVVVAPKTNPEFTATPNSTILCNGSATGSITVVIDPTKGASPYVINVVKDNSLLPGPPANVNYNTQTSGLPAGTYIVTVTDAKGCLKVITGVVINEPTKITFTPAVAQITCVGGVTGTTFGSIGVSALTGGSTFGAPLASGYVYTLTSNNSATQTYTPTTNENHDFTVLNFGIYQLTVSDKNGCSVTEIISIASPVNDLDIKVTPGPASCTSASLIVKTTPPIVGGPYHFAKYPVDPLNPNNFDYLTYSAFYQNADAVSPPALPGDPLLLQSTFGSLNPGVTYSFIVYDETTKCYFFKQADTPTKTASTLVPIITSKNVTCKDLGDGKVSFKLSGFNAATTDVKYEIFNSQTNQPLATAVSGTVTKAVATAGFDIPASLLPGTYYILFTELNSGVDVCMNSSGIFTITQSVVPLTLNASSTKNDNCGTDQGVIEAFGQGGTVIKEDLVAVPPISAVPYLYQVFPDTGIVGVIDGADHNPNAVIEPSFPGTFNVATHTSSTFNKEAGNYLVYVRDAYGCIQVVPVTVGLDPTPTITATISAVNQCSGTEGSFIIDVVNSTVGGVAPFSYSLDGGPFIEQSAMAFTIPNLSSGNHSVEVKDFNGCGMKVDPIIILPPLDINASFTTQPTCKTADGVITAVATGGFTPNNFEYTLVNNTLSVTVGTQFSNVFTGQAAGNYTLTVKDLNTNCTKSTIIDLLIPTDVDLLVTDIVATPVDCNAPQGTNNNGTITVNLRAVNDNPSYTYTLTPVLPAGPAITNGTSTFTGLTAGDYTVTVTSGRGCFKTVPVNVVAPVAVTATATATAFSCAVDPTKTTAVVTGGGGTGTGTYTFSSDGTNYFASNSLPKDDKYTFDLVDTGLPQSPTYYVKDSNGCVQTATFVTALDPLPKLISAKATRSLLAGSQIDCANGRELIQIDVVGGSIPSDFKYEVSVDGTAYTLLVASAGTPFTYSALAAGSNYQFKITDNVTGCSILSNVYDVPLFNKINIVATAAANVTCNGLSNGAIEINVTGYTGAYDYAVYDGVTPVVGASGSHDTATSNPFVIPFGLGEGTNYTVRVLETALPSCSATSNVVVITEPAPLTLSTVITVVNKNCLSSGAVVTVPLTSIGGGTPGFTYAFVPAGASPAGLFTPSNTKTLATTKISPAFDLWDVYVQDMNGCPVFQTIQITTDPMPTVTATVASQCANPAGYTINVVGTGVGTLEYSLDGNSFQTTTSFSVSSPGSYTVTVRDGNKCTASATLPVIIFKPLALKGDVTKFRSCGAVNDGEITLTATDGSGLPNYEYSNGAGAYGASNVFSGLAAGTYTMNVRDTFTLCVKSVQVIIDAPTLVTVKSVKAIDVSCMGSSDGSITVTLEPSTLVVNNNPDYDYSLVRNPLPVGTPVTILNQKSNVFDNLEAGSYTVTTTSSRGCKDIQTISVGSPAPILVPAPVVVEYACSTATPSNAMNLATITVNAPSGGSGTYTTYEFIKAGAIVPIVQSGKSNVYTQADLSGGTFTINVYDDKGCVGTTVATIKPFVSIDFAATAIDVTKVITCVNDETIKVNVSTTGATMPMPTLIYNVKGLSTGSIYNVTDPVPTGVFTGLTVGDYMVTVTNPDTGCAIQKIHYINEPNTFDLQVKSKSDVVCFGSNEGSVELFLVDRIPLPSDESGPYSYVIKDAAGVIVKSGNSTNATPELITGLKAGTYSVTATLTGLTSPQCTIADKYFTINQPVEALVISETHTRITCASNNNGTISATAVGGWPGGYMYQLELGGAVVNGYGWSTVSNFTGLGAGNYTVKVRDSKGCENNATVVLSIPTPIAFVATPSTALLTCFGDTSASITVSAPTGGQGSNYLYTLNTTSVTPNRFSGPQASPVFANLGTGTYTITVTDGFSCSTTSAPIVISQPTIVKASLVVSSTQTCTVLTSLTLSATGGTGQYTYSADGIAYSSTPFASSVTFAVPTGTYHYYVKDANGCISIVSNDIKINPLEPLTIKLDVTNAVINCRGENTGVIVATANGGLGNYVYTLLDDATNMPITGAVQTTPGVFTQLVAGSYKVRVVSRDCNTTTLTIEIKQPDAPLIAPFTVTPVICNGNGDGKIVVNASGGTGVIKYAISPDLKQFVENNTFDNLKPGNYDVIVQDVLGCYILFSTTVTEPNAIDIKMMANSIIPEICVGDKNGAFKITVAGGVEPYNVNLDNPDAASAVKGTLGQAQFDFNGLTGGDHTVYVFDKNGCTAELKVSLPKAINLDPKAVVAYECDVNTPGNKVTVTVDPSNTDASDIDYTIDGVIPFQASNVFANVAPGLHYVEARHTNGCIQKFDGIIVDKVDPLSLSLDLGGLNEIVATVSGGSGIYQLTVNGEPMTAQNKFIYFRSGDYTVVLTDSYGCTVSATKYFEFIDIKIPPIFTPTGDGTNDNWKPTNTENYPNIKFIVYDRYGREVGVFGAGQSWDGKYNGTELPMGDYWYVLKLKHSQDDREFIGHFTLYR